MTTTGEGPMQNANPLEPGSVDDSRPLPANQSIPAKIRERLNLQKTPKTPDNPQDPGSPTQGEANQTNPSAINKTQEFGNAVTSTLRPFSELHVSYPTGNHYMPCVDIIAIHDIGEALETAWVHRKKLKRRQNDPRRSVNTTSILKTSLDETRKLGSDGSPAPGQRRGRYEMVQSTVLSWLPTVPETDIGGADDAEAETRLESQQMSKRPISPRDQDEQLQDAPVSKPDASNQGPVNVTDAGAPNKPSTDRPSSDRGTERRVNWLTDPHMLPAEIQRARVLCYTYSDIETASNGPFKYLDEKAADLLERLAQLRPPGETGFAEVPIVFIGLGFGALIAQRAVVKLRLAETDDAKSSIHLGLVAGVLLIDAPSPSKSSDLELYPRSHSQLSNRTWTDDWFGSSDNGDLGLFKASDSRKIDGSYLWNTFSSTASANQICLAWHYLPVKEGDRTIVPKHPSVMLLERRSRTSHRLSRFDGNEDEDFKSLVEIIKRSILVKHCTAQSTVLRARLPDLSKERFPVNLKDQKGLTPLHLAVEAGNSSAVRNLVYKGKASLTEKDNNGRSPLTTAIRQAVQEKDAKKAVFTQIIKLLVKANTGLQVDDKDILGNSPWHYATGLENAWIKRLRKNLIVGNSLTMNHVLERVTNPEPGSTQASACDVFDMFLLEIFMQTKRRGSKWSEKFNWDFATVTDVIYSGDLGVTRTLDMSRPASLAREKALCRWVHLPANNEQWVHDLLISSGIQDGSMGGQRHQGSPVIDRYMMPQAKRYKHSHGLPEKTQSTERPNAVRRGSSSESGITLTLGPGDVAAVDKLGSSQSNVSESKESDAIVIFLPIFGFECHRHRKYLSDAISNVSGELKTSQQDKVISEAVASKSSPSRHAKRRSEVSSSYYSTPNSPFKDAAKLLRNVMPASNQTLLLDGYLRSPKPVHCRRTLDQFSYYMLSSTETRDKSQVAYKWAKDTKACDKAKDRPIIMVDQLWVWILHNGTVITSFPTTWNGDESYDLMKALMAELGGNKERPLIRSAEHLLHLILRTSLDFCKRKGPAGFRFEDCFRGSINSVSEKQNLLFDEFRRITTRLEKGNLSPKKKKKEIESLLRLDEETKLLIEIMDIQDELTIIKTILSQQETVLQSLLLLYPKKGRDDESDEEDDADKPLRNREIESLVRDLLRAFGQGPVVNDTSKVGSDVPPRHVHFQEVLCHQQATGTLPTDSSIQGGECSNGGELARSSSQGELKGKGKEGQSEQQAAGPPPQLTKSPEAKRRDQEERGPTASSERVNKPETKKQKALLTHPDLMYGTLGIVQGHIRVVTNMLEVAEKVQSLLESLLDLKQKHANGWEARFSREGSEETQRQGNTILFFTIVTAIFLPLSFMASFFALDVDIFPKDEASEETSWPLGQVCGYLFGISASIFTPLVIIAVYVNDLSDAVRKAYHRLVKKKDAQGGGNKAPGVDGQPGVILRTGDYDSDKETTVVDHQLPPPKSRGKTASLNKPAQHGGWLNWFGPLRYSASSNDPDYAKLFGTFTFHTHIPGLRRLWKWQRYLQQSRRSPFSGSRWNDRYVNDYPLHHFLTGIRRFLSRIGNTLFMCIALPMLAAIGLCLMGRKKANRSARRPRRPRSDVSSSYWSMSEEESDTDSSFEHPRRGRFRSEPRSRPAGRRSHRGSDSDRHYPAWFDVDLAGGSEREDEEEWSIEARSRRTRSLRRRSTISLALSGGERASAIEPEAPSTKQKGKRHGRLRRILARWGKAKSADTEMGERAVR